jgi:hypothetical protein
LRPNPDGFAPEVRAEMEKLFWWGIRALLSLTTGGPEEAYAEGGQNGELNLPPVSTEISQRAVGFRLLVPTDSGTRFVPRSLEPGAGNLCTFRHAKLLVPVRMRCRVIASFCGGDAGLLLGQPLFGNLQWGLRDFWLGILASLPLLALFFWLLRSSLPALERIGEFLEARVRTVFEPWAIWQLAVISLLAGRVRGGVFS